MNKIIKELSIFLTGGIVYFYIEILYRGYSHFSMIICGGICFSMIGKLNDKPRDKMPIVVQMFYGMLIITMLELITGLLVNKCLGLNVWDYSDMPLNLYGQICFGFSFIWLWISVICIVLDDIIKRYFFDEEKKSYYIIKSDNSNY